MTGRPVKSARVRWHPDGGGGVSGYFVRLAVTVAVWLATYGLFSATGWVDPGSTRMWSLCTYVALGVVWIVDIAVRRRRRA
jgi:hypothetical protein